MFSEGSRRVSWVVCVSVAAIMFCSCTNVSQGQPAAAAPQAAAASAGKASIEVKPFGQTPDGQKVQIYTLVNAKGMKAQIMEYGAIVTSLTAPDKNGKMDDIVMGHDNLADYFKSKSYFGAIVGRYGNRIGKGRFTIDGKEYSVTVNDGVNHLHGGAKGFDKVVWQSEKVETPEGVGVKLTYLSKDGEEGYPGNVKAIVTYFLTNDNTLRVDYEATTDKATPINLTHHGYWNLTGMQRDILGHQLMINADKTTPVDSGLIPTGKLANVEGTPFDFRKATAIGARIDANDEQLKFGKGYDHNWVLNKKDSEMSVAAELYEPTSGRVLTISTTEPAIQFYSGNFLDGTITGKDGKVYKHRFALCLETQHYPDSPNKSNFPSTILKPGQTYKTTTIHKFSTR
jgi:aldose 1-epimerase